MSLPPLDLAPPSLDPESPAADALAIRGRDVAIVFGGLIGGVVLLIIIVVGVAFTLGLSGNMSALDGSLFSPSIPINAGAFLVQALLMTAPVYFLVLRRRRLPPSAIGFRPFSRRWYVIVPLVAVMIVVVSETLEAFLGHPLEKPMINAVAPGGFSWSGLVVMLMVVGVIIPIAEEVFFRGVFYTWLRRRWGPVVGIIVSALLFGALHLNPVWIAFAFILGIILALLYELSGSLWPAIGLHAVNNMMSVVTLYALVA